jgi:hypothetical protein
VLGSHVSQSPGSEGFNRIVIVSVVVAMLAVAVWLVLDAVILACTTVAQLNYLDGYAVDDMLRLARGNALYPSLSDPPHVVLVYTPIFFALGAAAVSLGADPFAAGRLLVLMSMLGSVAMVTIAGYRRTGWVAIVIGLGLILSPIQWPWSLVIRPDTLAILCSVAAVLVAFRERIEGGSVVLAAVLCVAAVFSKQSALAAPAAIALQLMIRDRRGAFVFIGVYVSMTAAIAVALHGVTNGVFFFHTITANANPFSGERIVSMVGRFLIGNPLFVAVLVVMVTSALQRQKLSGPGSYALISMITALGVGKIGSSLNYFLEPTLAVALWAALEFPVRWISPSSRVRAAVVSAAVAVTGIVAIVSGLHQLRGHAAVRAAFPLHSELSARLEAIPGPVVCDDATLLVAAGKAVHYRPFIMAQLAAAGVWDQRPFLEELDRGEIALIVMRVDSMPLLASRYTSEMREVIARRYRKAFAFRMGAEFVAFEPVEAPAPRPSAEDAAVDSGIHHSE